MNTNAFYEGDSATLIELELRIARRADELKEQDGGRRPGRDFWREAENEIWVEDLWRPRLQRIAVQGFTPVGESPVVPTARRPMGRASAPAVQS